MDVVKKRGRPSKKYDSSMAEKIQEMAGMGISQDAIAQAAGLSPKTLRKLYRAELEAGIVQTNLTLAKTLYQKAIQGDTACLIFWAKTRMGWSEKASFIGREILERYRNGELSVKDTALELEMNGIPLPDSIRILLGKEQPEPEDASKGEYCVVSDEEMEILIARKQAELNIQREGLPGRRAEMKELHKRVQEKFAPGASTKDDGDGEGS